MKTQAIVTLPSLIQTFEVEAMGIDLAKRVIAKSAN